MTKNERILIVNLVAFLLVWAVDFRKYFIIFRKRGKRIKFFDRRAAKA
jgi:hypothetical protein